MLKTPQIIITENNDVISHVREMFIRIDSAEFCIYAEVMNTSGSRSHYIVKTIENKEDKLFIDLEKVDFTPLKSENEKLIDIREFYKD